MHSTTALAPACAFAAVLQACSWLFLCLPAQVRFLEYIRQWQKKVVFVINKADMLTSPEEVEALERCVALADVSLFLCSTLFAQQEGGQGHCKGAHLI